MTMKDVEFEVDGARITGRLCGNGTRSLVFVHGIMVNGHVWDPLVEALSTTCRLVLLDLPLGGHWRPMNAGASGELDAHAARVIKVVEQLGTRVTLVGSDTGGAIAQLAVAARPDLFEALVLLPSDAFDNCPPRLLRPLVQLNKVPRLIPGIAKLLRYRVLQEILMTLVSKRRHSAEVLNTLMGELPHNEGVQRDLSKLIAGLRPEITSAVVPSLATYQAPVLILWSCHDPLFPGSPRTATG